MLSPALFLRGAVGGVLVARSRKPDIGFSGLSLEPAGAFGPPRRQGCPLFDVITREAPSRRRAVTGPLRGASPWVALQLPLAAQTGVARAGRRHSFT